MFRVLFGDPALPQRKAFAADPFARRRTGSPATHWLIPSSARPGILIILQHPAESWVGSCVLRQTITLKSKDALMAQSDIATDETSRLIASNKVEGTAVYNAQQEKLGAIHNFMVDKVSGQVEYAILSFGGLFGLGADYYPLPWNVLTYDTEQGGYVVDLDKSVLDKAPRYSGEEEPVFDRAYGRDVYGYYGVAYPW
jgi:hypothetical protein